MSSISKETLQRLPAYLRHLKELQKLGVENVASKAIAQVFNYTSVQVRKDFASISGEAGRPKTGFSVNCLVSDIAEFLGYNNINEAVLVGVGNLGHALLSYSGFKDYGLDIVGAFDVNPNIKLVHGHKVYDLDKLIGFIKQFNILIGIIAVPKDHAQKICDLMIGAGIKAIWNFSPCNLVIPENIAIINEDMASSLALLSQRLAKILKNQKNQ